jgi:DNA-binding transcriptional LysR family regulator
LFYEFDREHWLRWFAAAGVAVKSRMRAVQIDDSHALRRSVLDGHGVGLFFAGLLEDDLKSGLLHAPFAQHVDPGSAYYFVKPRGKPPRRALLQFERWLLQQG